MKPIKPIKAVKGWIKFKPKFTGIYKNYYKDVEYYYKRDGKLIRFKGVIKKGKKKGVKR